MCLTIARIFADDSDSTSVSSIFEAVEYCADVGARVINMSLGFTGGDDPEIADPVGVEVYKELYDAGVLVVAAAGNDGTAGKSYPASHEHVISVAAVDEEFEKASFSQFNEAIDIAAPGVDILSTGGGAIQVFDRDDTNRTSIDVAYMRYSPIVPDNSPIVTNALPYVDCGYGSTTCASVNNKACLIERGSEDPEGEAIFFWQKAMACQNGGGLMALIYNNENGTYAGDLTVEESVNIKIPVFSVPREQGLMLLTEGSGFITIRMLEYGYLRLSGTSMASPHVAGVAARIWASRPQCSIEQIETAIFETAIDLGDKDRDDIYGHGFIQAVSAYEYLLTNFEPCGDVLQPSSAPSAAPSLRPSASPSSHPSSSPSEMPSKQPSSTPSQAPTISPMPTSMPSISPSSFPTTVPTSLPTSAGASLSFLATLVAWVVVSTSALLLL